MAKNYPIWGSNQQTCLIIITDHITCKLAGGGATYDYHTARVHE